MKYVLTWRERSTGSATDYEAAQKRVLELFGQWQMPETLVFREFVVRVGEFGGYAVLETDDLAALHRLTTAMAMFAFTLEPVVDIMDAVGAEAEAIAWRDSVG